jgi:hypothetical protein
MVGETKKMKQDLSLLQNAKKEKEELLLVAKGSCHQAFCPPKNKPSRPAL